MSFQTGSIHKNLIETKEIVFPELVHQAPKNNLKKKIKFRLQVLSHRIKLKKRSQY